MSLVSLFHGDYPHRPPRTFSRHFGLGLDPEEFLMPFESSLVSKIWWPRRNRVNQEGVIGKDEFQLNLDLQHFRPEEISVKVAGENTITIEGKHEEREDEHGFDSRRFVRKFVLPEGHDIEKVASKLSSDGVLTITAPKIFRGTIENHREIPIQETGEVAKRAVESEGR